MLSYYQKNRKVTLKNIVPQQAFLAQVAGKGLGARCDESLDVYRVLVAMHSVNPERAIAMWAAFTRKSNHHLGQQQQHQPIKIAGFFHHYFVQKEHKSLLHYDYFVHHFSVESDNIGNPVGPLKCKAGGKVILYKRDFRDAVLSFIRSQPNESTTMGKVRAALLERYHFQKGDFPHVFWPTERTIERRSKQAERCQSQLAQTGAGFPAFQNGQAQRFPPFQPGQFQVNPSFQPGQFRGIPPFHPGQLQGIPPPANPNNERRPAPILPKPEQCQSLSPLQLAQTGAGFPAFQNGQAQRFPPFQPGQFQVNPSFQPGQFQSNPSFRPGQFQGIPSPQQQLGNGAGYSAPSMLLQQRYAINMAQQRSAFDQQQKEMLQQQSNMTQQQYHHTMSQAYREASLTRGQVPPPVATVPASASVQAHGKRKQEELVEPPKQNELVASVKKKPRCSSESFAKKNTGDGAKTEAHNITAGKMTALQGHEHLKNEADYTNSEETQTSSDDVDHSSDSIDDTVSAQVACKKESVFRKTLSGLVNLFGFGSSSPAKESG